jgi:hypothetical protein
MWLPQSGHELFDAIEDRVRVPGERRVLTGQLHQHRYHGDERAGAGAVPLEPGEERQPLGESTRRQQPAAEGALAPSTFG